MEAIVVPEYGDASTMEVRDQPAPDPEPGQVQVDIEAVGINWADIDMREGNYPDGPEPPFVSGVEAAGRIAETGDGVTEFETGETVFGLFQTGAYAETAVTRAEWVLPKPDCVGFVEAASLFAQGFTAHNILHEWGHIQADDTVLVHAAAGGVGSLAVQLAADTGATVIGTASTAEKLAFATDCGADHVVNYETENMTTAVEALTEDGVSMVLDGVGGATFYNSMDALRTGGRIVVYGVASGSIPTVATPRLFDANVYFIGYSLNTALKHEQLREQAFSARESLYDAVRTDTIETNVTETRPLSEASQLHRQMESRETTGKLVLVPDS